MGQKGKETYRAILEGQRDKVRKAAREGRFDKNKLVQLEKNWKEWDFENRSMNK